VVNPIPNLWATNDDAERLYRIYLGHLQLHRMESRIIEVCPVIRRYAAKGPGRIAGLLTFHSEIDALCELKQYDIAWKRLRLRDEIAFGKPVNVRTHVWSPAKFPDLTWYYAPLLYFQGRFREGCRLLETALDFYFAETTDRSYGVLFHIYNDDREPWHRCRVTLSHFYRRLGVELGSWRHWETFVNGFPPKVFRLVGVPRETLLKQPSRLRGFFRKLIDERDRRESAGVDFGLADLIDSPAKVQKRQEMVSRERAETKREIEATRAEIYGRLKELFPELRKLLR
jgi:hypothetical protein